MGASPLSYFLQGAAIGVSAALSPGPYQSLVIAQALLGGWRRAAPVTFAPLLADIPIAITLVSVISQVPAGFLRGVQLAGAALLAYLAFDLWRELRRAPAAGGTQTVAPQSPWRGLLQGTLMLFLSPGSYLFWALVLGPLLLQASAFSPAHGIGLLLGFYLFSIGGLLAIAYALGRVGQFNARARRILQMASLALMVLIAAWLVYSGLRS